MHFGMKAKIYCVSFISINVSVKEAAFAITHLKKFFGKEIIKKTNLADYDSVDVTFCSFPYKTTASFL